MEARHIVPGGTGVAIKTRAQAGIVAQLRCEIVIKIDMHAQHLPDQGRGAGVDGVGGVNAVVHQWLAHEQELVFEHRIRQKVVVVIESIGTKGMGQQELTARDDIAGGRREVGGCHPLAEVDVGIITDRPDCLKPSRS